MHSSTEPTQAPPAHARTTRSVPAAPSRGVPDRFGDALNQALVSPEPAGSAAPAASAPTETMKAPPATTPPALPAAAATPKAGSVADPSKPEKDGPAAPVPEAQEKTSVEAAKPSADPHASAPSEPILPALPQASPPLVAPFQVAPMVAQPVALPSKADDAVPSTGQDSSTAPAAGSDGRQPPFAPAPAAAQATAPSASTPPSRAAAPSGVGDTAAPVEQKHSFAVTTEKEPSAATSAMPADAAPLPTAALAVPPSAAPTPVSVAPHLGAPPPPPRPSAAGEPAPPPAAAQVGPVLASFAAGVAHPGAPQHLTIRLDPLDLGRVQVRIERSPDGSARVDLKVEKPDTLLLLLRDQPQLHRALDLAGVPSTERTLQFHLAPPDAPMPGGMAAQSTADHGHGQQRPGQPYSGRFATNGTTPPLGEPIPGPPTFHRAGVDITA